MSFFYSRSPSHTHTHFFDFLYLFSLSLILTHSCDIVVLLLLNEFFFCRSVVLLFIFLLTSQIFFFLMMFSYAVFPDLISVRFEAFVYSQHFFACLLFFSFESRSLRLLMKYTNSVLSELRICSKRNRNDIHHNYFYWENLHKSKQSIVL